MIHRGFALEIVSKPGYFVGNDLRMPTRLTTRVPVFETPGAADRYRWSRDALIVMASRVVEVEWGMGGIE